MAPPLTLARRTPEIPIEDIAPNAAMLARAQIDRARSRLTDDPGGCLVFPFRDVDALVGPVRPGRLVFLMAPTGHGKTTFLLNVTRQLLRQNVPSPLRIDYLGTEQEPDELWTKLACLDASVPADVAINLAWDHWTPGAAEAVDDALVMLQTAYGESGRLRFVPDKFITLERVERAAQAAADAGQTLLVVDHIDRIETRGDNEFQAMRGVVRRLKELARDCDLVLVVGSQTNRLGRQGDRLAVYHTPRLETMRGGGTKEEEADVVLGVYRPLRSRPPLVNPKEWSETLARVRRGEEPAKTVIAPDRMGVALLKHRTRSNEGAQCFLRVEHGVLSDEAIREGSV